MLIGVLEPRDLDVTSATPANSMTARTAPPAATPEPSTAGQCTLAPPNLKELREELLFQPLVLQSNSSSHLQLLLRIASGTS